MCDQCLDPPQDYELHENRNHNCSFNILSSSLAQHLAYNKHLIFMNQMEKGNSKEFFLDAKISSKYFIHINLFNLHHNPIKQILFYSYFTALNELLLIINY